MSQSINEMLNAVNQRQRQQQQQQQQYQQLSQQQQIGSRMSRESVIKVSDFQSQEKRQSNSNALGLGSQQQMSQPKLQQQQQYQKQNFYPQQNQLQQQKQQQLRQMQQRVVQQQKLQEKQEEEDDEDDFHSRNSSSSEISYDEDMILEQVRCSETQSEMKQFIEVDEFKCSFVNPNYQKIYPSLKKKTLLLMGIAKKYIDSIDSSASESKNLERKNASLTAELTKQHEANVKLYARLEDLRVKQVALEQKCFELSTQQQPQTSVQGNTKHNQKGEATEVESDEEEILDVDPRQIQIQIRGIIDEENKVQKQARQLAKKKNALLLALATQAEKKAETQKSMCIICQEKPIDCLLQPCNHACTCFACAQKLETCPMDRLLFTNTKKFFLS